MNIELIIAGLISGFAAYILLWKLGFDLIFHTLKFENFTIHIDALIDIAFTILLALIFNGTYSGMIAAVIGGLTLSVLLTITRLIKGTREIRL